jgi:hypothetical protein
VEKGNTVYYAFESYAALSYRGQQMHCAGRIRELSALQWLADRCYSREKYLIYLHLATGSHDKQELNGWFSRHAKQL